MSDQRIFNIQRSQLSEADQLLFRALPIATLFDHDGNLSLEHRQGLHLSLDAQHKEKAVLDQALAQGANPNAKIVIPFQLLNHASALHFAVSLRHEGLVSSLLDAGADLHYNHNGLSALSLSLHEPYSSSMVNLLLQQGASPLSLDVGMDEYSHPFSFAMHLMSQLPLNEFKAHIPYLLLNDKNEYGSTLLMSAASHQNTDVCFEILHHHPEMIHDIGVEGFHTLHYLFEKIEYMVDPQPILPLLSFMFTQNANVLHKNDEGLTPKAYLLGRMNFYGLGQTPEIDAFNPLIEMLTAAEEAALLWTATPLAVFCSKINSRI